MMENLRLDSLWYEWERQRLLREYEAVHASVNGRIIPHDLPRPKLSDVLRCARLAKAEPQIWNIAQKESLMSEEELHFEDDGGALLFLMSPFIAWFRLNNSLYDHDDAAFVRIVPTLREWARPDFDGDEVTALRQFLSEKFFLKRYIDDLADETPSSGDMV